MQIAEKQNKFFANHFCSDCIRQIPEPELTFLREHIWRAESNRSKEEWGSAAYWHIKIEQI